MVLYVLTPPPLCEDRREYDSEVLQSWYADDAAMDGYASRMVRVLRCCCEIGADKGYFQEPVMRYFVCKETKEPTAREVFRRAGIDMPFTREQRYVDGFVGSDKARDN